MNAWVGSVTDRLAAHFHSALALLLFALTAPDLVFLMGRPIWSKAGATRVPPPQLKSSAMSSQHSAGCGPATPQAAIHLAGFCFGGHAAFLAPGVAPLRRR